MTTLKSRIWLIAAAAMTSHAWAEVPQGWIVAGSKPAEYEFSRDATTASSGRGSALILARANATANGFGTLMQSITADSYRDSRVRLSAMLKTADAHRAQMWLRVDGPEGKVLSFDNMDSRPVTGTTGWKRYEIVLDVPADSIGIAYGFFLMQQGKVWADSFRLEKVDASVPLTSRQVGPARAPSNTDFEE